MTVLGIARNIRLRHLIYYRAAEGIWYENAYTTVPTCCSARQSLLVRRRPESLGAHCNFDITLKILSLEPDEYTWTKDLSDLEYKMDYIGKWHVNPDHVPTDYGYDYYLGVGDYVWGSFNEEFNDKPYIQQQLLLNWQIEDYSWEDWAPIVVRYYAAISQVDVQLVWS